MANRVTLKSANTAVIVGDSPAFKTSVESGFVFAGVNSASYGFSNVRAELGQLGSQGFEKENIVRQPDVTLTMSYGFTPTFANEELIGMNYNLDSKPQFSITKNLDGASNNFYFYNHPEQGFDGLEYIKNGEFPNGGEVVSIGNAYLTSYNMNFAVGSFPTVDLEFDCSNIKIENYFSQTVESPAINLESGNNIGVGSIDLLNVNYLEPRKFGDIYDLDRTKIETILPHDINIEMDNLVIGGQKLELQNHRINQFSVSLPIDRANLYRLGSDYVCDREVQYPINGKLSMSSFVTNLEAGFISGLVEGDQISNLRIISSDCRKQITSQFYFEELKLENINYQTLVNEQTNYELEFSFQITEEKGFKIAVTEQDIGVTRFIDENNSVYQYILGTVTQDWVSGDLNGYKVAFGELREFDVLGGAFADCTNINQSIFLPETIINLGDDVFNGCINLPSFYSDSTCQINTFGERCFKDCSSLEDIFLPVSVKNIQEECFMGCDSAGALFLQDIINIGDRAFYNCSGFNESLYLPDSLATLGESAFENCSGFIGGLNIGSSLKEIKQKTFKNARGLSFDLKIPNNISGIGTEAFYKCESFNGNLELSSSLSSIEDYTFYECNSLRGNLIIPDNVDTIGIGAFQGCNSFDGFISLPEVTTIGDFAFSGCSSLQSKLSLNSGILSVGDKAFMGCDSLSLSLNVPSGINAIGDAAFSGCVGITDVYINSPISIFQGNDAFAGIQGCMYVAPVYFNSYRDAATAGLYQGMPVCYGSLDTIVYDAVTSEIIQFKRGDIPTDWYTSKTEDAYLVIGSTCKVIESGAFTDSVGLQGFFVLPEEVESIGDYAFKGCSFDGELLIPDTVRYLGSGAFEDCTSFDDLLIIGEGINSIKGKTFKNCSNINGDILLNSEILVIEDEAFYNCSGVSGEIFLGFGLQSIGDYAFWNCENAIGDLEIPPSVGYIGDYAFYNCASLDGVFTNSEDVSYIGNYAFENCSLMTGPLILPGTVTYLGSGSFKNCQGLDSEIDLSAAQIDSIYEETFFNCSNLNGLLVIPDNVISIGDRAFSGCDALTESITITNIASRNIGVDAFNSPLQFEELIISQSVQEIIQGDFDYFKDDVLFLTMQQGLVTISGYAFSNYAFQGDLDLPSTVDYIGDGAFSGCNGFGGTYLFESSSVRYIGDGAFYSLSAMDGNIDLSVVGYIGDRAFYNNTSVNGYINLGAALTGVGEYAFADCSSAFGDLIIPNTVSGLGQYAFENCSSLSGVISLPNNEFYNTIKTGTFKNCSSLSGDLLVHDYITTIEPEAFLGCVKLDGDITITDVTASTITNAFDDSPFSRLIISDSVTNIENTEFDYFDSRSMEVVFQEGLSGILDNAFDNYNFIGELNLPTSLTGVGVSAFQNCNGFSGSLTITANVLGIGVDAFRSCSSLSGNLIIPTQLTSIGDGSFIDCVGFDGYLEIADLGALAISSYNNVFLNTNFITLRASSSDFLIEDGEFDSFESFVGNLVVTDSASDLGPNAFTDNYSFVNTLTINENSNSIGDYAFSGNSFIGDLYVPTVSVGFASFAGCVGFDGRFSLESIQVESVDDYAFYNCSNLSGNLIIGSAMDTIGDYSFYNMNSLNQEFQLCGELPEDFDGRTSEYDADLEEFVPLVDSVLTAFGNYAFAGNSNLSGNLVIPDSVTSWGYYAFLDMSSLNGFLILGTGSNIIREGMFKNCSNLKCYNGELRIPQNVSTIETEAFYNCSSLDCNIVLKPGVFADTDAFFNTNFTNIIVPVGTVSINNGGYDYFQSNSLGLIFEQPDTSFTTIGTLAFDNYNLNGNLNLPQTLVSLGSGAFQNNENLIGDLSIPDGVTIINDYVFENCGFNGDLSYSNSTTKIGARAFSNCDFTNEIPIPILITEIGSGAFAGCSDMIGILNLERNFVTSVGSYAFSGCSNLDGVIVNTLPAETFVGEMAFSGVPGVLEVGPLVYNDYQADSVQIGPDYYFQGIKISGVGNPNTVVYVSTADPSPGINDKNDLSTEIFKIREADNNQPYSIELDWANATYWERYDAPTYTQGSTEAYQSGLDTRYCWLDLGVVVDTINYRAFKGLPKLQGPVYIPDSCEFIRGKAFYGATQLDDLQLGGGLREIDESAFYACTSISNHIVFPATLEEIEEYAFYNCNQIPSIEFAGNNLSGIDQHAFGQCNIGGTVEFPDNLLYIGTSAFFNNDMTSLVFNDNLSGIYATAFKGCNKIETPIVLPDSLEYMGVGAFEDSTIRGVINFPLNLTYIPDSCFKNNDRLLSFYDWNNVTSLGNGAFENCDDFKGDYIDGLWQLRIPEGVFIGESAFANCGRAGSAIEKIVLPNGWNIEDGGDYIFTDNDYVRELDVSGALYIQPHMFSNSLRITTKSNTFGENLSGIGASAFRATNVGVDGGFDNWGDVYIPSGVKYIGPYAFEGNKWTSGLNFHENSSLERIEDYSFQSFANGSAGNRTYYLENPLYLFSGVQNDLIIPTGVRHIGTSSFKEYYSERHDIYVGSGVSGFGNSSFSTVHCRDFHWSGTSNLKKMPNAFLASAKVSGIYMEDLDFEKFDYQSFYNFEQTGLNPDRNFVFNSGLSQISTSAFQSSDWQLDFSQVIGEVSLFLTDYGNYNTNNFNLNKHSGILTLPKLADGGYFNAFSSMPYLEEVIFQTPTTPHPISISMFQSCPKLTGVTFPTNLTHIEYTSFDGCAKLKEIDIRATDVTYINNQAFRGCSDLTDVELCNGVINKIWYNAFQDCTSLNVLTLCDTIVTLGTNIFQGAIINELNFECLIEKVPDGTFNQATVFDLNITSTTVKRIGANAFRNAVIGPDPFDGMQNQVWEIGSNAFENTNLSGVIMPTSLSGLYNNTFKRGAANYNNLSGVDFSLCSNFTGIGNDNFYLCGNLDEVIFPNSMTGMGSQNFELSSINTIDFSNTLLKGMVNENFKQCLDLQTFVYSPVFESMGNSNFEAAKVDDVVLPETLKTVGNLNWFNCEKVGGGVWNTQPLSIPCSIETIGDRNWEQSSAVQEVLISGCFSGQIGDLNWKDCASITKFYLDADDPLASIGSNNFENCSSLTQVYIRPNCGSGFWQGTNNFLAINNNAQFFVDNSVFSEYNNATFSGAQGLPNGVTMQSV